MFHQFAVGWAEYFPYALVIRRYGIDEKIILKHLSESFAINLSTIASEQRSKEM